MQLEVKKARENTKAGTKKAGTRKQESGSWKVKRVIAESMKE